MTGIVELLSNLTDPERVTLFYSDNPEEYILLGEYVEWLDREARRASGRGVETPTELADLIELLDEILRDVTLDEVYNEGKTLYFDRSRRVVEDPWRHWLDYVAENPRWKRALELAGAAAAHLEREPEEG